MFNLRNITTALALGLALAAATPSLAAERSHHPGHAARAQAVSTEQAIPGGLEVNRARAKAIQDCQAVSGRFAQHSWGNAEILLYRSCMAEHGQAE